MKKLMMLLVAGLFAGPLFAQSNQGTANVMAKVDTTTYPAAKYKVEKNSSVFQLLSVMEGFQIMPDGSVKHKGQVINRVKMAGRYFEGLDIVPVMNRIPADIVDNIQVVDAYNTTGATGDASGKLLCLNFKRDPMPFIAPIFAVQRPDRFNNGQRGYRSRMDGGQRLTNDEVFGRFGVGTPIGSDKDDYGDQIPHFLIPPPPHTYTYKISAPTASGKKILLPEVTPVEVKPGEVKP